MQSIYSPEYKAFLLRLRQFRLLDRKPAPVPEPFDSAAQHPVDDGAHYIANARDGHQQPRCRAVQQHHAKQCFGLTRKQRGADEG